MDLFLRLRWQKSSPEGRGGLRIKISKAVSVLVVESGDVLTLGQVANLTKVCSGRLGHNS